tara:strand:- start:13374 stop:14483 length:1110 start_codon:yes stop_codon:yes gene_type:complete
MIELLLKLGGIQALLLSILLVRKKTNNNANVILAVLIFFLGLSCLFYSFNSLDFYVNLPHLIRIDWGIPLLFGPLIYLYTKFLTGAKNQKKLYLHFLPYLLNLSILTPFFIKSGEEKILILDYFTASITGGTDLYFYYGLFLQLASSIICLSYAAEGLNVLNKYNNTLLNEFSNTHKQTLKWLKFLLISFIALSILFIGTYIITYIDPYPSFDYNVYYFFLLFVLIYVLSYRALNQPEIIVPVEMSTMPKIKQKVVENTEEILKLKEFMLHEKPYLNGEITASELAKELSISRHQLSQLLNNHLSQNFYDFINEYRVEEFKKRIQSQENNQLTLLAIALDSGFNSKTTFNTIFKKATGMTPSQYKKEQK